MRILVIGGTVFVGRHTVEAALARGYEVTVFHRGQHNPDLFPGVEKLRGNRDGDLGALHGRQWDAVVDTCGYVPRVVRQSAELLADAAQHYTFISSLSVYPMPMEPGLDERAPVDTVEDETTENIGEAYGALKALCEKTIETYFPGRALHVRAGLIIGPYDYIDRFPYWVDRVSRGGEVLAPGRPERRVQCIDARDIAEWNLDIIEANKAGTYNVTGPATPITMADMLNTIKDATDSDARFTWLDDAFLNEHEVSVFAEMPYWLPDEMNGLLEANIDKALRDGLRFRPLTDSARDVHAWNQTRQPEEQRWRGAMTNNPMPVGMSPEREGELMQVWHARQSKQA